MKADSSPNLSSYRKLYKDPSAPVIVKNLKERCTTNTEQAKLYKIFIPSMEVLQNGHIIQDLTSHFDLVSVEHGKCLPGREADAECEGLEVTALRLKHEGLDAEETDFKDVDRVLGLVQYDKRANRPVLLAAGDDVLVYERRCHSGPVV